MKESHSDWGNELPAFAFTQNMYYVRLEKLLKVQAQRESSINSLRGG